MATVTLSYPMACSHNGLLYLVGYKNGQQFLRRSHNLGLTWMRFADNVLEKPICSSDPERVAFVKMETQGGRLVVGVPVNGEGVVFQSKDDGESWE